MIDHIKKGSNGRLTSEPNLIIKINRNVLKNLTIAVYLATDNPS